ncbi:MAG: hypothetical protein KGQ36_06155 [Rickettsiales bacterium]|nr:hypothetical protein [Rickettsiales bacterium]
MKIRLILAVIFVFTYSQAIAKEFKIKAAEEPKLVTTINDNPSKENSSIEDLPKIENDMSKIFVKAEEYYKAAKAWNKLKCEPKTGFICTKWECNKRDIKASLVLDKKTNTVTRCEGDICDKFSAEFKQTGVFYNIQSEGPIGTLIRILGDSRYKEISTVGLDAYIVNGNCEVIN